jgi:hypothetical protein
MSKPRDARRLELDGQPMAAVTPEDYERLLAVRRQVGSLGPRLHALRYELQGAGFALISVVSTPLARSQPATVPSSATM